MAQNRGISGGKGIVDYSLPAEKLFANGYYILLGQRLQTVLPAHFKGSFQPIGAAVGIAAINI